MSDSVFLNSNDGTIKNEAMLAKVGELRKQNIMTRCFPGYDVAGLDFDSSMSLAGADFSVRESTIRTDDGPSLHVPSHKALIRTDVERVVACVGESYGTIQHIDALAGLRPLVDNGDLTMEKVQVSDGGATVTATAFLGFSKVHQIGRDHDDALVHFARIRNSHGFGSAESGLYTLRLTCLNGQTGTAALERTRVAHTRHAAQRVPDLHHSLVNTIAAAKAEAIEFQRMADDRMALEEFIKFSDSILTDIRGEADTDRKRKRREKDVLDLTDLFCEGAGNVGASKYDAYNAFTDWLTARQDQYADSAKFAAKFAASESGSGRATRARVMRKLLNK